MKKLIFLTLVFLVLVGGTGFLARAAKASELEVSGVVTSFSPSEIRISQKYGQGRYFLYIFKMTDKTRIIGIVRKWSFVRVKYSQKDILGGFITIAQEIELIHPPNAYYQRMY